MSIGVNFSNMFKKAFGSGSEHPDTEVAASLARHGLMIAPPVFLVIWLLADQATALSAGYAMAIILTNFLLSAYLLRWAAQISLGLVASIALGGYALRLALVFIGFTLVKDMWWMRMVPFGIALIASHLGLLAWELRSVSATFAHPGLKPKLELQSQKNLSNSLISRIRTKPKPAAGYAPRSAVKSVGSLKEIL